MQHNINNLSLDIMDNKLREDLIYYGEKLLENAPLHTELSLSVMSNKIPKIIEILKNETISEDVLNQQHLVLGNTALMWAVANTCSSSALLLLKEQRIKTNIQDLEGKIALHLALAKGFQHINSVPGYKDENQASIIVELIKRKEDLNIQDNNGNTPLHIAAIRRDFETVERLLKAGASPNISNKFGYKPADMLTVSYENVYLFLVRYASIFTLNKTHWNLKKLMIEQALNKELSKIEEHTEAVNFLKNSQFYNSLETLLIKSEELAARGFAQVAEQAFNLVETLVKHKENYKQTGDFEQFKQNVIFEIEQVRPVLGKHRGFKSVLEAIVQIFIGFGRYFGLVSGNNAFFKTDTASKLDNIEHVLCVRN